MWFGYSGKVATVAALAEEVSRKALCTELPALVVGPVAYPQRNVAERVSSIPECPRGGLLGNPYSISRSLMRWDRGSLPGDGNLAA